MVTSYGISHFYNIYCSFQQFYFPWEVPWGPLGGPLGSLGEVWEDHLGSFGSSQGRVACRDEILEISGESQQATHRQPVPLDAYISKGILMFASPPKVV